MNQVLRQWTAPEDLADGARNVADACAAALAAGDADRGLAAMRRFAETTTDVDVLRRWLESGEARPGLAVDRDTRWLVVRRLVVLGEAGVELVESEAADDRSSSGHQARLTALASRPEAAAKEEAWRSISDPAVSNRDFEALVGGLWTPGQVEFFGPYLDRYLAEAPRMAQRGQAFAAEVAFSAPRTPLPLDRLQRFRDDLEAAADATELTVLRRGWRDTVDDYDVAIRVRLSNRA
jgi:aminopeptidase N